MSYTYRGISRTSYTAIALLGMLAVLSGLPAVVHAQSVSITTSRSSAFQLLLRGRERLQRKDYKGAFSDFNQAIILNPNDADNYVNRGFLLQQLGDEVSALSDFDRAVLINPHSAIAYFERGGTRYSLGDLTGGILDLQQAANLFAQQGDRVNYQKAQNLIRQLRTPI